MRRKSKELGILAAIVAAGCVWGSCLNPVDAANENKETGKVNTSDLLSYGVENDNQAVKVNLFHLCLYKTV